MTMRPQSPEPASSAEVEGWQALLAADLECVDEGDFSAFWGTSPREVVEASEREYAEGHYQRFAGAEDFIAALEADIED